MATSALQEIDPQDPDAAFDQAWIDRTEKQVRAETDRMELELRGYKNDLIKESVRGHGPYYFSILYVQPDETVHNAVIE